MKTISQILEDLTVLNQSKEKSNSTLFDAHIKELLLELQGRLNSDHQARLEYIDYINALYGEIETRNRQIKDLEDCNLHDRKAIACAMAAFRAALD